MARDHKVKCCMSWVSQTGTVLGERTRGQWAMGGHSPSIEIEYQGTRLC